MGRKNETAHIPVTVDMRNKFGWLRVGVQKKLDEAVKKERSLWLKPSVISVRAIARSFIKRMRSIRKDEEKAAEERKALLRMWAQHGARDIEGIAVTPSTAVMLDESALIAELDPKTRAKVVETRPHLKLPELFELARTNEKLQTVILGHLSATAKVSLSAPKD